MLFSQETIVSLNDQSDLALMPHSLFYAEAPNEKLTREKALQLLEKGAFAPCHVTELNLGMKPNPIWVSTKITNTSPTSQFWYITNFYPPIEKITFHIQQKNHWKNYLAGKIIHSKKIAIKSHAYSAPLLLQPGEKIHLLVKLETRRNMTINLWAYTPSEMVKETNFKTAMHSLFIGIILFMIIYHLIHFVKFKDIVFLYFIGFSTSFCLITLNIRGIDFYFLPEFFQHFSHEYIYTCASFLLLFLGLFTQQVFTLKKYQPKVYRFIYFLNISTLLILPIYFNFNKTLHLIGTYYIISTTCIYFLIGVNLVRLSIPNSKIYLSSQLTLSIGIAVYILQKQNNIPISFISEYAIQISVIIEILFFSFLLIKQRDLQIISKEKAQLDIVKLQHEHNLKLKEEILRRATELEITNENLQSAIVEAQKSNSAKNDFLANMSHELRTPLNGIIGINYLMSLEELNEQQTQYNQLIESSANTLLNIINDVLDIAKIESGNFAIQKEPFSFIDTINEISKLFSAQIQRKNLQFNTHIDPNFPHRIFADRLRIKQVLFNLLGNAIKFTKVGYIAMNVTIQSHRQQRVKVAVEIKDTGIGIPAEKLNKIFDKFEQADASTTREYGGTGLGLSIALKLANLMGGDITVKSYVDEGSTFTFTFLAHLEETV